MYTSYLSSLLKAFVFTIVLLLLFCSLASCFGFIFADKLPALPIVDICKVLCTVSTILLALQVICFALVVITQIFWITSWFGYMALSGVAVLSYIAALLTSPEFFQLTKNFIGI